MNQASRAWSISNDTVQKEKKDRFHTDSFTFYSLYGITVLVVERGEWKSFFFLLTATLVHLFSSLTAIFLSEGSLFH